MIIERKVVLVEDPDTEVKPEVIIAFYSCDLHHVFVVCLFV
jgi:hypothetical protein